MNAKQIVLACSVLLVATGFATLGTRAQSAHDATQGQAPTQAAAPKKAEEQFKNIQVLKGIPADQLIPTMEFIRASLGVGCEYCHEHDAFDKDDKKPKQIARKMMEMMIAINADNFDGHRMVTCNSCHNGNAKPQSIPAVMGEEPKESAGGGMMNAPPMGGPGGSAPADAKGNTAVSADQLLDKYVQAAGGAAAIDKVTSRIMKGTIDFGGKSFPIDIYGKDPDERISFTHMPEGDSITAFNGREGWLASPGRPGIREMHGSELDAASMDADVQLATHLKGMFSELQAQGTEKVGDRKAYVVVGMRTGNTPIRLYFDEQSGLLVRLVRFADTALGWLPTQIDYADYRDANGVKIPYRWTLARPSGRFTIQVSDVKQNVPVEDAKFVKPAAEQPKAPSK
ncbi:MAG TPA: c-type cytochrome [Candidatus Sulfotelmatobacter sp.]|jgi:hypothetical protein